jgi:hypothetical protein
LKRIWMVLVTSAVVILTSGCAARAPSISLAPAAVERAVSLAPLSIDDGNGNIVQIQKVEFQSGVSSITVERLAKRYGCEGGNGAGRITGKGPREMYRMTCDNGQTFLAKCELRQCKPVR